jgi:hypothetical protein
MAATRVYPPKGPETPVTCSSALAFTCIESWLPALMAGI